MTALSIPNSGRQEELKAAEEGEGEKEGKEEALFCLLSEDSADTKLVDGKGGGEEEIGVFTESVEVLEAADDGRSEAREE